MKDYPGVRKHQRQKYFDYKLSSARITIENAFSRLKARFRYLHRVMDSDLNALPQVIHSCFILHNYCEIKNERLFEQNLLSSLNCKKRAQPPKSNLTYKESVNENAAKNIYHVFPLYFE